MMLKDMKSYGHMKPGEKGTNWLVEKFGAALVCVRYRYEELTGDNLTTAEIIVDRRPGKRRLRYRNTDVVAVAVPYTQKTLREKLKMAGGRWDPEGRVWRVEYGSIRGDLTLMDLIVRE